MNWKLTFTKALVLAAIAFLASLAVDLRASQEAWLMILAGLIEPIRDLIKWRFGMFESPTAAARRRL